MKLDATQVHFAFRAIGSKGSEDLSWRREANDSFSKPMQRRSTKDRVAAGGELWGTDNDVLGSVQAGSVRNDGGSEARVIEGKGGTTCTPSVT